MTSANKKFCAANNIRLSGRPRKKQIEAEMQTAEQQELFKSDLRKRSVIVCVQGVGRAPQDCMPDCSSLSAQEAVLLEADSGIGQQ
jgi:hypothetical protein